MSIRKRTIVLSSLICLCSFFHNDLIGQQKIIFSDEFLDNTNKWELFESKMSKANIEDGKLKITSLTAKGTSRFINVNHNFEEFDISTNLIKSGAENEASSGLLIGFSDWDNYLYFTTSYKYFSIGYFSRGVHETMADMNYSSELVNNNKVNLRVSTTDEYFVFYINNVIQFKMRKIELTGNSIGVVVANKSSEVSFENLILKSVDSNYSKSFKDVKSSGSGFIISQSGYIVTNHHVVEGSSKFMAEIISGDVHKEVPLAIVSVDPANDLALLRIVDSSFSIGEIPYGFKSGNLDLGVSIFTLGFPLFLSGLGNEPKFTDGRVSAKSGFNNAINSFQTNLGVQPGNSGGPVFNSKGELVGVVSAKITNADNVSYAVKSSYLQILLESANIEIPSKNLLADLSLEEQLKKITDFVVLIKVY